MFIAQINFKLVTDPSLDTFFSDLSRLASTITSAAVEGYGSDFEVFINCDAKTVGLRMPYKEDIGAVEAGAVMGYCLKVAEMQEGPGFMSWLELFEVNATAIYCPFEDRYALPA